MDERKMLGTVASFVADVLGNDAEVVVHDALTGEIIFIENGHITGRAIGQTEQRPLLNLMERRASDQGRDRLVGYRSATKSSHTLRASNLFLHDDDGSLRYVVCINQSVDELLRLRGRIDSMLIDESASDSVQGKSVEDTMFSLIMQEIEREKPFSFDSRDAKLSILRRLEEKGVFEIRGSAAKVCELLQIAQATLYKYLREIRGD